MNKYTKKELREVKLESVFNKAGIMFCSVCRKGYYDDENLVSIKETDRCLHCDHVETDEIEDLPF